MADNVKKLFQSYINAATDLAESVKRNITQDGVIDDTTVNKLNDLIIATNALANLPDDELDSDSDYDEENETDPSLN